MYGLKKRVRFMLLVSGVVLALSGCKGEENIPNNETAAALEEAAKTEAVESQAVTESAAAAQAAAPAETKKTAEMDDSVRVLSGTVKDAGTGTVTVISDRYPDGVTFNKEDSVTQFKNGLLLDQKITLFYRGDIKNGDTSEVTVELLRDYRDSDAGAQAAVITGQVVSVGMSVISIETEDGKTVSFEQDPKPVSTTDGIKETDRITIIYSYQDEGGEGAIVPELIKNAL